jgi:hypothetical protein
MKILGMTAALAAAAFLAVPTESRADVRVGVRIGDGYDYNRSNRNTWRTGYDRGLEDGRREGFKDVRRHERFSFWDEGRYRDGDAGYRGWMGPRYQYVSGYRRGFEEGYRSGYRSYGDYRDRRYGDDRDRRYDRY